MIIYDARELAPEYDGREAIVCYPDNYRIYTIPSSESIGHPYHKELPKEVLSKLSTENLIKFYQIRDERLNH